jgi:hypothetical protein
VLEEVADKEVVPPPQGKLPEAEEFKFGEVELFCTSTVAEEEQPEAGSVKLTVYTPAVEAVMTEVFSPVLHV